MVDENGGFHERLEKAFAASGISQAELGRRVGASPAAVSDWFNKNIRAYPKGESMLALPAALGVSGNWLFWNQGPMYVRDTESVDTDPIVNAVDAATARIAEVIAALRQEVGLPTPPAADMEQVWDVWARLQQIEALRARLEEEEEGSGQQHGEPDVQQG